MSWIAIVFFQLTVFAFSFQQAKREGKWSWSLFFFVVAFICLDSCFLSFPVLFVDQHSRWFVPAILGGIAAALGNFVWLVVVCRRWKMPGKEQSAGSSADRNS
jgi:protein-S-isoprenylcysteine O-methyltransferase Ste14